MFYFLQGPLLLYGQIDSLQFKNQANNDTVSIHLNQNTADIPIDSSKIKNTEYFKDPISAAPSVGEINSLFYLADQGKRDPFIVANEIAEKMDNAIPGLKTFLLKSIEEKNDSTKTKKLYSNGLYAVIVLDKIGTITAKNLLREIASTYSDKEVRGLAVKTLACNLYNQASSDSLEPDKEVLHVLLQNAEDTTYISYCGNKIGKLAKEGIRNWTGNDYDNLLNGNLTARKTKAAINNSKYNEQWWQNNSDRISWDVNLKQFKRK
jgi:hypothetical protein